MTFIPSSFFLYPSVGLVLILLVALLRYIVREKYAQSFSKLPDSARERLFQADRVVVQLFRIFLWLSPLYLVIVPLIIFFVDKRNFLVATICMVLLVVTVGQEYLFRKWLINYLETKQLLKSGSTNELR